MLIVVIPLNKPVFYILFFFTLALNIRKDKAISLCAKDKCGKILPASEFSDAGRTDLIHHNRLVLRHQCLHDAPAYQMEELISYQCI